MTRAPISLRHVGSRSAWIGVRPALVLALVAAVASVLGSCGGGGKAKGPASDAIAFSRETGRDIDIYTVRPDGSDLRRLVIKGSTETDPAWSPDGKQIAFTSGQVSGLAIWVMRADGRDRRQLTRVRGSDFMPAWSPDGSRIAFVRHAGSGFVIDVMKADGMDIHRLTSSPAREFMPAWSPDGKRIAFARTVGKSLRLFVVGADGRGERQLVPGSGGVALQRDPAWSPDGKTIAFSSAVGKGGDRAMEIFTVDAGGGSARRLTDNKAADLDPTWSAGGDRITFSSDRDGDFQIYTMDRNGKGVTRVTRIRGGTDQTPDWRHR